MTAHQRVIILDYGSQYTQLIARRIRESNVYSEIHPGTLTLDEVRALKPDALILGGGPGSVYDPASPQSPPGLFELGIPVLGINTWAARSSRGPSANLVPPKSSSPSRSASWPGSPRKEPCRSG
jgi:hypothetical protein